MTFFCCFLFCPHSLLSSFSLVFILPSPHSLPSPSFLSPFSPVLLSSSSYVLVFPLLSTLSLCFLPFSYSAVFHCVFCSFLSSLILFCSVLFCILLSSFILTVLFCCVQFSFVLCLSSSVLLCPPVFFHSVFILVCFMFSCSFISLSPSVLFHSDVLF